MKINRRTFCGSALGAGSMLIPGMSSARSNRHKRITKQDLVRAASKPVLDTSDFKTPIKIRSIELYRFGNDHFVKTTSEDGAVGIAITNSRAHYLYPILENLVRPVFLGKDARQLEALLDEVYLYKSNYKISNLALWCPQAWVEFSILDMLGKIADKPVGALLGGIVRKEVSMYIASGNRHTTPQEEAKILANLVEKHQVKAVKFKVGGRMRNNQDSLPGRTEGLIPLVRKTLGDDITIHADSNGSYDAQHAIKVGKMLQDIDAYFFEEPCPFDDLEGTKQTADALDIPIAGGEQESSHRRFQWMIENDAVQVVQPDLHYYGGFIRAKRVARMAALKGMPVTLHMGGSGVGFVDVIQFCSCTPNAGKFQEYKSGLSRVGAWYDPPLRMKDGKINVPEGPGLGINTNPDFLRNAKKVI